MSALAERVAALDSDLQRLAASNARQQICVQYTVTVRAYDAESGERVSGAPSTHVTLYADLESRSELEDGFAVVDDPHNVLCATSPHVFCVELAVSFWSATAMHMPVLLRYRSAFGDAKRAIERARAASSAPANGQARAAMADITVRDPKPGSHEWTVRLYWDDSEEKRLLGVVLEHEPLCHPHLIAFILRHAERVERERLAALAALVVPQPRARLPAYGTQSAAAERARLPAYDSSAPSKRKSNPVLNPK